MRDFHGYKAYQDSMELCELVYRVSRTFPGAERWELSKQVRRAVVSVAANIAEGAGRRSGVEFARFLDISVGSLNEVETHLEIGRRLGYVNPDDMEAALGLIRSTRRQLRGLSLKVREDAPP